MSLTRVGVRGIEKVIRVGGHRAASGDGADGPGNYFFAELECFVDLNPRQAGVHMSRFEEVVGEAIDGVVLGEALRAEELATHIATRIREQQQGLRAEVTIAARYPETVRTPVSGSQPRRSTRCSAPPWCPSAEPARSPASRPRG